MTSSAQGDRFIGQSAWLSYQQLSVLRAITRCRTAALGGHIDQCSACGHQAISYNSCRNRHCPKCQAQARQRWITASSFAVQIAKHLGAEVTGVSSGRNTELVHSLGADHTIDYTQQDYTQGGTPYDLIIDSIGNHSLSANRAC